MSNETQLAWSVGVSFAFVIVSATARDLDGRYADSPLHDWFNRLASDHQRPSTLQVRSMCNLYSITNESGCDPQSDRVYDTTGAVAVRRAKVA